jgi:hypothetical protein
VELGPNFNVSSDDKTFTDVKVVECCNEKLGNWMPITGFAFFPCE